MNFLVLVLKGASKRSSFSPQNSNGVTYFNLGFGDWNATKKRVDDLVTTNNQDREKVLATVAAIVIDFLENFPDAWIYVKGSTPARTRLYQMGLRANWEAINSYVVVYGYTGKEWQLFQRKTNYFAFLALKK